MSRLSALAFACTVCVTLLACPEPKDPATTAGTTTAPDDSSGATTSPAPVTSGASTGASTEPADTTGPASTSTTGTTGIDSSSAPVSDSDPVCVTRMIHETAPFNTCDPFAQDCLPCEKCNPYADDGGGSWNADKCVPVAGDPAQVGEPCTAEGGGTSGLDDCDHGAMCWDVDDMGNGTCVALCTGNADEAMCADPSKTCAVYNEGTLPLCLDRCDPLAPDACPDGDVCIGNPVSAGFLCVLDSSGDGGQVHTPCMYSNSCDPGLLCNDPTAAEECVQTEPGCCEPFCDLTVPDPDSQCPGVGQQCLPYFEPDTAPMGDEDVGYCAVMM